jgi:hypothetical protein
MEGLESPSKPVRLTKATMTTAKFKVKVKNDLPATLKTHTGL